MENGSLTQFVLDGLQDAVWVAKHAGSSCADLNEVFSHGLTQEHRIECRYFIHSHWRDIEHLSNLSENKYKDSMRLPYTTQKTWCCIAPDINIIKLIFQKIRKINTVSTQLWIKFQKNHCALFIAEMGSHPCCLWAKSSTGMVAACLCPSGYIEIIASILYRGRKTHILPLDVNSQAA